MNYAWEFTKAAFHCALRGQWAVAWMYVKWARAQLGPPPF